MEVLSVSALALKRPELASRGASRGCGASRGANRFKMDANASAEMARKPVVTSSKSTRCFRPKEWSLEVEEGELVDVRPTEALSMLTELDMHSVPSAAGGVARPEGVHGNVRRAEPLGERAHPVHAGQEQRVLHVLVRLGVGLALACLVPSLDLTHGSRSTGGRVGSATTSTFTPSSSSSTLDRRKAMRRPCPDTCTPQSIRGFAPFCYALKCIAASTTAATTAMAAMIQKRNPSDP
jgi:hypothetical protein